MPIESLPFTDSGTTVDLTDIFDVACPFTGQTAPDAWYTITPDRLTLVSIDLCESSFDTKLYVVDSTFEVRACNDDGCSRSGGGQFRSMLDPVPLDAGRTYYIVVDGSNGDLGAYELTVEVSEFDCELAIPTGALPEDEICGDPADPDLHNGGCAADPDDPVVFDVACGDAIVGTTWAIDPSRNVNDTDWYLLPAFAEETEVQVEIQSAFAGSMLSFSQIPCDTIFVPQITAFSGCGTATATFTAPAGVPTTFVMLPGQIATIPCTDEVTNENAYVLEFACGPFLECADLGDLDGNDAVDFGDLLTMLAAWETGPGPADLDGSGDVGFEDLLTLLANFGPCP